MTDPAVPPEGERERHADADAPDLEAPPMVAVYRHDVHKLRARGHAAAADEFVGVPVNEPVPLGADRDAALLSRPAGQPEQTVATHTSPYRLSLLTGAPAADRSAATADRRPLVTPTEPERLHATWLTSPVPAAYNESLYYPYTSLKYHTLLAGALLDQYRAGHGFDDLWLMATVGSRADPAADTSGPDSADTPVETALASETVVPFRTVLWTPACALHVTAEPAERPAARLGAGPARSFADVWSRLPTHPIDTAGDRRWRLLDAQVRRIRSWSVALQYIDDYVARRARRGG